MPRRLPATSRSAILAIIVALGTTASAICVGCGGTPDPAPPPAPGTSSNPDRFADQPWQLTPPDTFLAFAPGAEVGHTGAPEGVERSARLWLKLTDARVDPAERAEALLQRMRPTCAIGRYGLPPDGEYRPLFARMFVRHLDSMAGDVDALALPWHYRQLGVRDFATLPPAAIHGWEVALRIPDLPGLLESGGVIVLLGPEADVGNWMLCTVWMHDLEKLAALHVLRSRRDSNP